MKYIIFKDDEEIGYFLISDNAGIADSVIDDEIISRGYCEIDTVGEINCYIDSSREFERKDDSKMIMKVDEEYYNEQHT